VPRLTEFNNTPIPLSRHEPIPPHNNTSLPISFVPPSSNSRRGTAAVRHCPISDQTSSITATTKRKKSISKLKTECTHTVETPIPRPYSKSFAHPMRNRFVNALANRRSMNDGTKRRNAMMPVKPHTTSEQRHAHLACNQYPTPRVKGRSSIPPRTCQGQDKARYRCVSIRSAMTVLSEYNPGVKTNEYEKVLQICVPLERRRPELIISLRILTVLRVLSRGSVVKRLERLDEQELGGTRQHPHNRP